MQQEQSLPPRAYSDQPTQRQEGTLLEHDANIGIDVGAIARQEKITRAQADVDAAIRPAQPPVAETSEYMQNSFEEHRSAQIKVIGQAATDVVYRLRRPRSENSLFSTNDDESTAPYLQSPGLIKEDEFKEAA
jgi:hypothetical protein